MPIIWIIIGAAAAVVGGAIVLRLVLRKFDFRGK